MNVRVEILFDPPYEGAWVAMEMLGQHVTNDPRSVRVFASDEAPNRLSVEFAMPSEAPYKAVEKVEGAVRLFAWQRLDTIICFPISEAERVRAQRKAERRRQNAGRRTAISSDTRKQSSGLAHK